MAKAKKEVAKKATKKVDSKGSLDLWLQRNKVNTATPIQTRNATEGKISLYIKPGLIVFIKPGDDPEKIKAKYLNKSLAI